jgi:hypothetical protein
MLHSIFNPLTAIIAMSIVILGISIWGMVTEEGTERSDDESTYLAPDVKEKPSDKRQAA